MGLQAINGQTPEAPEVSILTSAETFPEGERDHSRWRSGVAFRGTICLHGHTEGVCRDPADDYSREDPDPDDLSIPEFVPATTYLPHGCDGFVDEPAQWEREAQAALDAKLAWHVERELWTGAATGNPSLQSAGVPISDSAPIEPESALSVLAANFAEATQGIRGVFHVPEALALALSEKGSVNRQGNRLVTTLGHIVIPGTGYPTSPGTWGPKTDDDPNGIEAPDGAAWIYMSGPVEFARHDLPALSNMWEARRNLFRAQSEVKWIYRFDPCAVFAALAKIPNG